ncbi:HTH domain-containing protein [Candidatus Enterococcus moelleringii]|uniref:HTH domain-containing protein n=1 Tax=Candidatus Enterococcus moelleringii TaxID=2815325 RepID=UPI001F600E4F|nr:HTH domain-containing protein [Enterococcus sp. 669A]
MSVHHFTDEQRKQLEMNPFVKKVSSKAITYSEAFKEHFCVEYALGKQPTQIFREAGFDPVALGQVRIDGFAKRVRKMSQRAEGFEDQRATHSGRPRHVERTTQEELAFLRHQLKVRDQQIEVLKKTNFIHHKAETKRKRNSPSSNE